MVSVWVTAMSTHVESVVNPLVAACDEGYVPDVVHLLSNPGVEPYLDAVTSLIAVTTEAYGNSAATVNVTELADETDFRGIIDHIREPIAAATETDTVAVDVTPGRKFMSAIAFQAGIRFAADHVFYLHLDSDEYFGAVLPDIPRTAAELVDFSEVF
ncbi:hypothetical protein [Haloarchaeobius sp. HRN-SO-5]|uniref:hypothetical protein n=1 Tax=Haloarchaeobius sp. HRN-SO-5 TaxID=3446118 RepID=UPI003EC08746